MKEPAAAFSIVVSVTAVMLCAAVTVSVYAARDSNKRERAHRAQTMADIAAHRKRVLVARRDHTAAMRAILSENGYVLADQPKSIGGGCHSEIIGGYVYAKEDEE